ncbi:MAG: cytochrome ubiquinol oxidase subunit I [Chloroflexi bacterium]|nr:cytochrome ubiquinol oxidase subunit I [Chloroflexota bacterium]
MDVLTLSRWQFAITTVYHFFFVPLTLGISVLIALVETQYVRTGDEKYKQLAKFWGKLFLINFAIGVATGLVQEFQFGMNWSEYSRFMGDIFGAPLAIEALLAFYMESTFIGVWVFGWEKLSKKAHLAAAWLVALGSNLSALWILIANSFMQEPVGYKIDPETGRALMANFFEVATNPNVRVQWPHVFFAGMTTAGIFVASVAAYHLYRRTSPESLYRTALRWGVVYALIGSLMVTLVGHVQGQYLTHSQPMKMAAAEALWETEDPADFLLFAIVDEDAQQNTAEIKIPRFLSFLVHNKFSGEVRGIKDIQAEYEQKYGPGDYIPPVALTFWSFRIMVTAGLLMLLLAFLGVLYLRKPEIPRWYLAAMGWSFILPYIANSFGWIMAEVGRQPWIVYGLLLTKDAVSPNLGPGHLWFSLIGYIVVYGLLIIADVYLLVRYAHAGAEEAESSTAMAY